MKTLFLSIILIFGILSGTAQINEFSEQFPLPTSINESSGAIFFNDKLITHNDSGGESELYELDTISGQISRTVTITNATNVDWEDLAQDPDFIYIADIGNNNGDRTDLKIYKISKTDYLNSDSVEAQKINFNYKTQTDFTSRPNQNSWDAEALISFTDTHLMLFSKNWIADETLAYLIPKAAGSYSLEALEGSFSSGGLITGATYNLSKNQIFLVGYTSTLEAFVWVLENFDDADVFSGTNTKTLLSSFDFEQVEAIALVDQNRYFLTSEAFSIFTVSDYAKLIAFSYDTNTLSTLENSLHGITVYPNPVTNMLRVNLQDIESIEVYNKAMSQVQKSYQNEVDMSDLSQGLYILKINVKDQHSVFKKVLKN